MFADKFKIKDSRPVNSPMDSGFDIDVAGNEFDSAIGQGTP